MFDNWQDYIAVIVLSTLSLRLFYLFGKANAQNADLRKRIDQQHKRLVEYETKFFNVMTMETIMKAHWANHQTPDLAATQRELITSGYHGAQALHAILVSPQVTFGSDSQHTEIMDAIKVLQSKLMVAAGIMQSVMADGKRFDELFDKDSPLHASGLYLKPDAIKYASTWCEFKNLMVMSVAEFIEKQDRLKQGAVYRPGWSSVTEPGIDVSNHAKK